MHKFILCAFLVACTGCAKDHSKPPANLSFTSVDRKSGSLLYDIRYRSDIDVLDLFGRGERVGMASGSLECALADDTDFSVDKAIQFSAVGLVESDKGEGRDGSFSYITNAFLVETYNNRSSQRHLPTSELNQLLSDKQQIPCKVVVTAYGYKPYYSNTMNIPVADLLREVNKP
ncbi:hypothetical protein [Pseudomonas bananamidigenes]|uniref:hypothetical protein n=1 Tax=Pseudomonas bananamidigenes TaxID=2843610 RepID=UPI000803B068|nr:hypothetical protein [Pseudomonas bananamidigenes]